MTRQEAFNKICNCAACRVSPLDHDENQKVALSEGRHTKFILFRCMSCGKLKGFPEDNLLLFVVSGYETEVSELFGKYVP